MWSVRVVLHRATEQVDEEQNYSKSALDKFHIQVGRNLMFQSLHFLYTSAAQVDFNDPVRAVV